MGKWIELARSYSERGAQNLSPIGAIGTNDTAKPWCRKSKNGDLSPAIGANDTIGTRGAHAARLQGCQPDPGQLAEFHERAAIAEFEGGLPPAHAEVLAALQAMNLGPDAARIINGLAKQLEFLAKSGEIS